VRDLHIVAHRGKVELKEGPVPISWKEAVVTMTSMQGAVSNHNAPDVRSRVKDTMRHVQRATGRAKHRVEAPIRDRPVRSMLLTAGGAVLLGFLAGMLTGRKTL